MDPSPDRPRILAIMGSGEIAPTMARVHRALFERFGRTPAPAVVIDTPYGFQENADELSARTVAFFRESVGREFAVASFRSRDADEISRATAVARIREARYVMAGPGSPSYALRHWAGGAIPDALADKLADGGIVTMASAAALTLGVVTIPVYEIYKVGDAPTWLAGLDLLGTATGLRAAVVPHFDNAEGGTHDTRFCYMGERRLRILERALPDGAFILGVDGHTALILDLDRRTAAVAGLGGVTVRVAERATVLPSGSEVPIETIASVARELAGGRSVDIGWEASPGGSAEERVSLSEDDGRAVRGPLRETVARLEGDVVAALDERDVRRAIGALLELDATVEARVRVGEDSPDLDGARATYRALIVRLGDWAAGAAGLDAGEREDPLVEALVEIRAVARASGDWALADRIREALTAAGREVRDDPVGSGHRPAASM